MRTEYELIQLAKAGDRDAFGELWMSNEHNVIGFISSLIQGNMAAYELAQDLAQETFINAFRGIKSFNEDAKFSTWVNVIARNVVNTEMNKRRHSAEIYDDGESYWDNASNEMTPEEQFLANEQTSEIERALKQIPDNQATALRLQTFEELSYAEIAEVMNLSISAVKGLVNRGKASLADVLR